MEDSLAPVAARLSAVLGCPVPLVAKCRCSRDRLLGYLRGFDASALADLRDRDGRLSAKCEFCSTVYRYGAEDGLG